MDFFLNDNDDHNGLETFINDEGELRFGMKMGENMGVDIEDGGMYMKFGDHLGTDL